jgi:hypothetical protein
MSTRARVAAVGARSALTMSTARIVVALTDPEYAGSYVDVERRQDGSLVLEPASVDAVIDHFAAAR